MAHFDVGVTVGFNQGQDLSLDVCPITGLAREFVSSDHHCADHGAPDRAPLDSGACQRVGSASERQGPRAHNQLERCDGHVLGSVGMCARFPVTQIFLDHACVCIAKRQNPSRFAVAF